MRLELRGKEGLRVNLKAVDGGQCLQESQSSEELVGLWAMGIGQAEVLLCPFSPHLPFQVVESE